MGRTPTPKENLTLYLNKQLSPKITSYAIGHQMLNGKIDYLISLEISVKGDKDLIKLELSSLGTNIALNDTGVSESTKKELNYFIALGKQKICNLNGEKSNEQITTPLSLQRKLGTPKNKTYDRALNKLEEILFLLNNPQNKALYQEPYIFENEKGETTYNVELNIYTQNNSELPNKTFIISALELKKLYKTSQQLEGRVKSEIAAMYNLTFNDFCLSLGTGIELEDDFDCELGKYENILFHFSKEFEPEISGYEPTLIDLGTNQYSYSFNVKLTILDYDSSEDEKGVDTSIEGVLIDTRSRIEQELILTQEDIDIILETEALHNNAQEMLYELQNKGNELINKASKKNGQIEILFQNNKPLEIDEKNNGLDN